MEQQFEWDAAKALLNERKHRLSFDFARAVFLDPAHVVVDASRERDGEARWKAIGRIGPHIYAVVFTWRGAVIRFVSARRTNTKEEHIYADRANDAGP